MFDDLRNHDPMPSDEEMAWMAAGTMEVLVRSVAGPLPLDGAKRPISHLRALRWPESAQPTRLQARGWVEGPDGRLLAVAADRCPAR